MTPFVDAPDKFQWKWVNLYKLENLQGIMTDESMNITTLPHLMNAVKQKDSDLLMELVQGGLYRGENELGWGDWKQVTLWSC